jgi:hypothetical protein
MIIGLAGYARSGKDTVAQYLVEHHGFTRMAFADPMREALLRLNPKITVNGVNGVYLASVVGKLGWETLKEASPDVRELLQRMGTEVGREMFGEHFWIDYLMNKALEAKTDIVISDVRFINEANAVRLWNGQVWRVNRPNVGPANDHISETGLDEFTNYDVVITNDSTLENLHSELATLLDQIKVHNGS